MVLTNDEYQKAKSHSRLDSLLKLRNATKSYIIQCLADREIQKAVNDQQSKAYRSNCEVIHSPVEYVNVAAVDGVGWNSTTCKPQKLRFLNVDNQDEQQSENILKLKRQITEKDETIASLKKFHQKSVSDLKTENSRQSQTIQQLRAKREKEEKEKKIVAFKASNNPLQDELNNARIIINNLRKENNRLISTIKNDKNPTSRATRVDNIAYADDFPKTYIFENNSNSSYKGVTYKGKTSGNASSSGESTYTNLRNLLVSVGFCFALYKIRGNIPFIIKVHTTVISLLFKFIKFN